MDQNDPLKAYLENILAGAPCSDANDSVLDQPEFAAADKVLQCIQKVCDYILANLDRKHSVESRLLRIDIPADLDPLLFARFDEQLNEYSRFRVFDLLKIGFAGSFMDYSFMDKLQTKIDSIFLPSKFEMAVMKRELAPEFASGQFLSDSTFGKPLDSIKVQSIELIDDEMALETFSSKEEALSASDADPVANIFVEIHFNTIPNQNTSVKIEKPS